MAGYYDIVGVSIMDNLSNSAIEAVKSSLVAYCKFITPNDAGVTGGHQSGFHIHKEAYSIIFSTPRERGSNDEKFVKIQWQNDFETDSRFTYYGTATRNEYRLTRFGHSFPFKNDENIGNLLVLCKLAEDYYKAYVLASDADIDNFMNACNISPLAPNGIIHSYTLTPGAIEAVFLRFIAGLPEGFPPTEVLATAARDISKNFYNYATNMLSDDPDKAISTWIATEYSLFQALENDRYKDLLLSPSKTVEELVAISNTVLNRRKSRAGKSLEHHLSAIFDANQLSYSAQGITEGGRKPDFIFPGIAQYHDAQHAVGKLVFLGAKTTCKDRWRQVINEAAKIPDKHLFTLQQGISTNQLNEMAEERLTLVVPQQNLAYFPPNSNAKIVDLKTFITYTKDKTT